MTTLTTADYTVDYLVVGAGLSGLAFVDELLTRTSATVLLLDKRHHPGGHWVDSYPFVKLHQPANQYGVNSKELAGDVDQHGFNQGLLGLASGGEIQAYCQSLVRDRFLNSGRVQFLPSTEYMPDGTLRQLFSGKVLKVQVKKRLVDATYTANTIPLHHKRSFTVDDGVACIPPNHLPRRAGDFPHYTIIGAGKTAMDSLLYLLENNVSPSQIRWIIASDYWFVNRRMTQGTAAHFAEGCLGNAAVMEAFAKAKDAEEYGLMLEKAGQWMRLDPSIIPKQFHGATLSPREVEELRRVQDVVRKGHVTHIQKNKIVFKQNVLEARADTLYIDCSASGLPDLAHTPVFTPSKITIQMIRWPLIPYSAAKIALLESLPIKDEERNFYAQPISFKKTVADFVKYLPRDMENAVRERQNPVLRNWLLQSRLERNTKLANEVNPNDKQTLQALQRLRESMRAAYAKAKAPKATL